MRPMWRGLEGYLERLPETLPEAPRAILIVSGHWEAPAFTVTARAEHPGLLYDYYGFPPNTYEIQWPAPGAPWLADRAVELHRGGLPASCARPRAASITGCSCRSRWPGPKPNVPVVQLSLHHSLDPELHLAAGHALAPLRDEGVLVLGSGMSFHNLRAYGNPAVTAPAAEFDHWLVDAAAQEGEGAATCCRTGRMPPMPSCAIRGPNTCSRSWSRPALPRNRGRTISARKCLRRPFPASASPSVRRRVPAPEPGDRSARATTCGNRRPGSIAGR